MSRQRIEKIQQGAKMVLAFVFAPVLLGCAICLMFFPPTWALLWFLSRPQLWHDVLDIRLVLWREYWLLRGALLPRQFSAPTLALQKAAMRGDALTAKILLERGADANAGPFYGIPLLARVAENGDTPMVAQLLAAGANIEATYPVLRYTALHRAAYGGHADTVALLLRHGANHAAQDVYRDDALLIATRLRHDGVVRALLEQYQREESLPANCRLILYVAKSAGYGEIVQMLLDAGVKDVKAAG